MRMRTIELIAASPGVLLIILMPIRVEGRFEHSLVNVGGGMLLLMAGLVIADQFIKRRAKHFQSPASSDSKTAPE